MLDILVKVLSVILDFLIVTFIIDAVLLTLFVLICVYQWIMGYFKEE